MIAVSALRFFFGFFGLLESVASVAVSAGSSDDDALVGDGEGRKSVSPAPADAPVPLPPIPAIRDAASVPAPSSSPRKPDTTTSATSPQSTGCSLRSATAPPPRPALHVAPTG